MRSMQLCTKRLLHFSREEASVADDLQAEEEAATIAGSVRGSLCGSMVAIVDEAQQQQNGNASPTSTRIADTICGTTTLSSPTSGRPVTRNARVSSIGKGGSGRPDQTSSMAASFCEEVRMQIHKLQTEVQKRNASIAHLHVQIQRQAEQHKCGCHALLHSGTCTSNMPSSKVK
jgi:hypothetical protein